MLFSVEESLSDSLVDIEVHNLKDLLELCKEHERVLITMPDPRTEHPLIELGHWCYFGDE